MKRKLKTIRKSQAPTLWDHRRAVRTMTGPLCAKKNVLYVSLGYKRVGGLRTKTVAAIVYVSRKTRVRGAHVIPRQIPIRNSAGKLIGRLPTDVVAVESLPAAFGVRSGNLLAAGQDEGVCAVSFVKNGQNYLLTNAHVACDVANGGGVRPVSVLDEPSNSWLQAGTAVYATPIQAGQDTDSDFAIVKVPNTLPVDPFQIMDIDTIVDPVAGLQTLDTRTYWFSYNGNILQCSHVEHIPGPAAVQLGAAVFTYVNFFQLEMTVGHAAPGVSGSMLCRTDGSGISGCGLVFGGVAPTHLWVFPLNTIWTRVNNTLGE